MIRGIITSILFFTSVLIFGQINIEVSADKDTINFGDEIELRYVIQISDDIEITSLDFTPIKECHNFAAIVSPEEIDSLMEIEILDGSAFKIDNENLIATKEKFNGGIPLNGKIKVKVSSFGGMMLPKPIVYSSTGKIEIPINAPGLFVNPLGNMDDINPNWGIAVEEATWKDYLPYVYLLLGFALFAFGLYYLINHLTKDKKEIAIKKVKVVLPADVIAFKDLELLKEKGLWQKGDTKGYHTELTRIMRQYLEDRYKVNALEMTSSQLKREMNQKQIDPDIVRRFDDILQIADKVKFAKGNTGPELNVHFMEEAFNIVNVTKKVKIEEEGK